MASFLRSARLTRPEEFQHVFERGRHRRFNGQGFVIRVRENDKQHARLGLAIAKKSLRRAVDRNRVKRLVREGFRHHQAGLPAVDIVVLARPELASMNNADVFKQLEMIWRQFGRYYKSRPKRATTTE